MQQKIVYLNDSAVGELIRDKNGVIQFSYNDEWLNNSQATPLSITLPLEHKQHPDRYARPFFSTLTNNNIDEIFENPQSEYPGAVCFKAPSSASYALITPEDVNEKIRFALDKNNNSKTVLPITVIDNEFYLSKTNNNSHILKIYNNNNSDLITNEIFCTLIANYLGLPTANISRISLPIGTCLLVERTDRIGIDNTKELIQGIASESFSDALPSLATKKNNSALSSLEAIFSLVRSNSALPIIDIKDLTCFTLICLLCGIDTIPFQQQRLQHSPTGIRLLPFTDLICSAIQANESISGLSIIPNHDFKKVNKDFFKLIASKLGVSQKYLIDLALRFCSALPRVTQLIFKDFPALNTPTTQMINHLIKTRTTTVKMLLRPQPSAKNKDEMVA